MKKPVAFILLILLTLPSLFARRSEVDSLFAELDRVLQQGDLYVQQRERKIADYKQSFGIPSLLPAQRYEINRKLYDLYYPFKPDSAIVYAKQGIRLAETLGKRGWLIESKLRLATVYTIKSRFIDAAELLRSIPVHALNKDLQRQYYATYLHLLSLYPHGGDAEIEKRIHDCRGELVRLLDKESDEYKSRLADKLSGEGRYEEALSLYFELYRKIEPGTHDQARQAHSIAQCYRRAGDYEMQKKYFAIAAIADACNGIKENAALRALAVVCYETDDIERAYRYIYRSMEDAMFANVSFRMVEISQIFPIIERTYQQKVQGQRNRLRWLTACIGLLSLSLLVVMLFVMRQMKKLNKTRMALSEANSQLKVLNESLKKSNEEARRANERIREFNRELSEANHLKETYISQFLTICSVYIRKLENYQNMLNKKALENRTAELYKMLKSRDMVEAQLKELNSLFDTIFLDLYPTFIDDFNALMPESERFRPKNNELLNTELRIFALIRLGINDSSQIADFLHYSLATIYNYRTRVRNKALIPAADFEDAIMRIGVIE